MPEDELLRVLHALRLVGFGDDDVVASRSGVAAERARPLLASASADGWVIHRSGRISGWSLTVPGRESVTRMLAGELELHRASEAVNDAYRRFRAVNQRFLDLCTDWQLFPGDGERRVVNDHSDPAYDAAVISRLIVLDEVVQPVVADLAGALVRFGAYGSRFAAARRLVLAGERDWFTRPVIDSYHTVWFELHEDLLATLGLERTDEH